MDPGLLDELTQELHTFHGHGEQKRAALLLAPCNNFVRFHIHQLVQAEFPGGDLKSFSVGEGRDRRLVVGWLCDYVDDDDEVPADQDKDQVVQVQQPQQQQQQPDAKKRPDRQIYVPRHLRGSPASSPVAPPAPKKKFDLSEAVRARLGPNVKVVESEVDLPAPSNARDELYFSAKEEAVVEIHDFDSTLKTADLLRELSGYRNKFDLKWVDDTHALAVFVTESVARQALADSFGCLKLRTLDEATEESKERARACLSTCLPAVPRPATSTLVARRMMAGALGVSMMSADVEGAEREKIRVARMQKKREEQS